MEPFPSGSLVIVYLHSPREKFWGVLRELGPAGICVRGIEVSSFDDWLRGVLSRSAQDAPIRPSLAFYPLLRVEKMLRDEAEDDLGLDAQCAARTGFGARRFLEE
jgi:hypothetical protein